MSNNQGQQEIYFDPPAKLLVVDDSHLNRSFIDASFLPPDYDVLLAEDGMEGLEMAEKEKPELILLDIMMPGLDGFEVAEKLQSNPVTKDIPIIFITALDALKDKLKAFDAGAADFVTKPFNHKELMARVKTNLQLRRLVGQKEKMIRIAMEEKRNSAIARIAAGISHNFNNMLGASFGNIMLVESLSGGELNSVAKDALGDIKKSLGRMQTMVKQFLALSNNEYEKREKEGKCSSVNLRTAISSIIDDLVSQKADTNIKVNCANNIDEKAQILCNLSDVKEAFQLIFNEAIVTTAGKAECVLSSSLSSPGKLACRLDIKGIPRVKSAGESIFEPFALPIVNVGAGLSFAVAKQLIEFNGGTVSAEFPDDDTTVFTLTFNTPGHTA